jgi:hypothetical protein
MVNPEAPEAQSAKSAPPNDTLNKLPIEHLIVSSLADTDAIAVASLSAPTIAFSGGIVLASRHLAVPEELPPPTGVGDAAHEQKRVFGGDVDERRVTIVEHGGVVVGHNGIGEDVELGLAVDFHGGALECESESQGWRIGQT